VFTENRSTFNFLSGQSVGLSFSNLNFKFKTELSVRHLYNFYFPAGTLKNKSFFFILLLSLWSSACRQSQPKENPSAGNNKTAIKKDSATVATLPDTAQVIKPDTTKLAVAPNKPDSVKSESVKKDTNPPGWPVKGPEPLPGSILPGNRIIAFYGNPLSKGMGILGQLEPEQMFAKLDKEVAAWQKADPSTPVKPAFHVIVVTAQGKPGPGGKYRLRMSDFVAERVIGWAEQKDALVFLDLQIGQSSLQEEIPRLAKFLQKPNVHLGIDAEFALQPGQVPGKRVGTYDAKDINYASQFLADLVKEHNLPPKLLIVHRFTQRMITNYRNIKLDPRVQIVMHMDGWGNKTLKRDSYYRYIQKEPVQYTGFKLFYKNDVRKKGWSLMTPEEVLRLKPQPLYIQYQ